MGCTSGGVVVYLKGLMKRDKFTVADVQWNMYELKSFG